MWNAVCGERLHGHPNILFEVVVVGLVLVLLVIVLRWGWFDV